MKKIILLILLFTSQTVFACMNFSDCPTGSACLKAEENSSFEGMCVSGVDPSITYSSGTPIAVPGCQFITDCDPGARCVKYNYELYGICLRS